MLICLILSEVTLHSPSHGELVEISTLVVDVVLLTLEYNPQFFLKLNSVLY